MDNADRDMIWLYDRMAAAGKVPTDKNLDDFVEKVAMICADRMLSEEKARLLAVEALGL